MIEIIKALEESTEEVLHAIDGIADEQFNQRPSAGGWSPGEIISHIITTEEYFDGVLHGKVSTIKRRPDERFVLIDDRFLNYDVAYRKGKNVPSETPTFDLLELKARFINYRKNLEEFVLNNALDLLCEDFSHGLFGQLTRLEWVYFHIVHARRHMHQLSRTLNAMEMASG